VAGDQPVEYLMSFVTGGLFYREALAVAALHQVGEAWGVTSVRAFDAGAFPVRKASSARRSIREIAHRLKRLSDQELALLLDGERDEQKALLWVAVCRTYRFVGEFAEEVIADRYLSLRTDLTYDDFDAFYARKAEWSDKLTTISESTKAKLRAVLFRFMRESGILGSADRIEQALLSNRLLALLNEAGGRDFRFFPGTRSLAGARP
jgi:hypothetical protein